MLRGVLAGAIGMLLVATSVGPGAAATPHASTDSQPTSLVMVPPPTEVASTTGSWSPDASTRILVTDEDLATEAARLAEELATLGILDAPPPTLLAPEGTDTKPTDIVLSVGDEPTLAVTSVALIASGATPTEVFRVTRPLLQQLVASEHIPAGEYAFALPEDQVRAVHIDIARKHYPIESLEALLFQMSWYGMNELELHFSENEGFAIESTTHPSIASPDAHSQAEIATLVELANSLHIRVTPSLDMPGHLDYALDDYPELRLRDPAGGEVFGALDITNPDALAFADDLIGEYAALFAQPEFETLSWHLGGDEFVNFGDQYEVAALTEQAQAQFGPDATAYDALTAFVNDIGATIRAAGYRPRVFSDGMLRGTAATLDQDIEVAYWTQRPPGAVPASVFADRGYDLINLNDEYLYFVLGERVEYYYPTGEAILTSWNASVYPAVAGAAEIIPSSRGGMLAIWSDIPDALTADEVVAAVRDPIAAMAVKFALPKSTLTLPELQAMLDASGHPAPVVAPDAGVLETIPPETTPPPAGASDSDASAGGGSAARSQWLWWAGALIALAIAGGLVLSCSGGKQRGQRSSR